MLVLSFHSYMCRHTKADHTLSIFLRLSSTNFTWSILEYFVQYFLFRKWFPNPNKSYYLCLLLHSSDKSRSEQQQDENYLKEQMKHMRLREKREFTYIKIIEYPHTEDPMLLEPRGLSMSYRFLFVSLKRKLRNTQRE